MKKIGDIIKIDLHDGSIGGILFQEYFELKITDKNIKNVMLPLNTINVGYSIKEQKTVNYFFDMDMSIRTGTHPLFSNKHLTDTEEIYYCQLLKINKKQQRKRHKIINKINKSIFSYRLL
jgi:hypothetical protein